MIQFSKKKKRKKVKIVLILYLVVQVYRWITGDVGHIVINRLFCTDDLKKKANFVSFMWDSSRSSCNYVFLSRTSQNQIQSPLFHRRRETLPGPFRVGSSSYSLDFGAMPLRKRTPPRVRQGNILNSYPGNVLYPYTLPEQVGDPWMRPVYAKDNRGWSTAPLSLFKRLFRIWSKDDAYFC